MARSRAESAKPVGDRVEVTLSDGRVISGTHCLMAVGAIPDTAGMGLEEAGVRRKDSECAPLCAEERMGGVRPVAGTGRVTGMHSSWPGTPPHRH